MLLIKYKLLAILASCLGMCEGFEWYTSTVHMENLVNDKVKTITKMEEYVKNEEEKLQKLKEVVNEMKMERGDIENHMAHPINQFILLRTLRPQYTYIHMLLNESSTEKLNEEFKNKTENLPKEEDVEGAAAAILRIQKTYNLSVDDIVNGQILDFKAERLLSAEDCFIIGRMAFKQKNSYYSSLWFLKAYELSRLGDESVNRTEVTNLVSYTLAIQGNYYHSIGFIDETIENIPKDGSRKILKSARARLKSAIEASNKTIPKAYEDPVLTPTPPPYAGFELYERLCRGEGDPIPPKVEKKLKCYNWYNNKNWLKIQPTKIEELWNSPHIVRFYDILSDNEMEKFKKGTKPVLKRAGVVNDGKLVSSNHRVSKIAWIGENAGALMVRINDRITDVTGLKTRNASEHFQMTNYGMGGQFEPHRDNVREYDDENFEWRPDLGDRIATMLFYLSDVELGGATVFLHPKIVVKPIKGSAVLWFNIKASGAPDKRTRHAGCPVVIGSKWVSNKWIRERHQDIRYPCYPDEKAINRLF